MRTNLNPNQPANPSEQAQNSREYRRQYRGRNSYRPRREYVTVTRITVENAERSVRLRFPGKPSDADRKILVDNGWTWSRNGFWYNRRTHENEAFANNLATNGFPAPSVGQFAGSDI